ncbi:MAG: hypothetical protein RIQ81_653 [Pseudomonadota bacterium]|jgi:hypothetical protein
MFNEFIGQSVCRVIAISGLTVASLAISSNAFAIVSGQVNVGKRTATSKVGGSEKTYAADEYGAGVWLDPIPLVPVAFGASMLVQNWDKDDFGATTTGSELSLDVKGWLPMVPVVTPYAKLSYVLAGTILSETTGLKNKYSVTGTRANIGVLYGILPTVSVAGEFGTGSQQIKVDETTVAGVKVSASSPSYDWKTTSYAVGVNVGF